MQWLSTLERLIQTLSSSLDLVVLERQNFSEQSSGEDCFQLLHGTPQQSDCHR
jgi:hypothetical protein